eukprot:6387661-Amphidinium_carterae.1
MVLQKQPRVYRSISLGNYLGVVGGGNGFGEWGLNGINSICGGVVQLGSGVQSVMDDAAMQSHSSCTVRELKNGMLSSCFLET